MKYKYCFVFLSLLVFASCQTKKATNDPARLVYDETDLDIGNVVIEGGIKTLEYRIFNRGGKPFFIKTVVSSCECTDTEFKEEFVYSGKETVVRVKFDPSSLNEGAFERMIGVYSSVKQLPDTLYFHGVAKHKKE